MPLRLLSPELLHIVCSYLGTEDVCQFRLACHTFASAGLRHLVPRVTVVLLPESLEHLAAISRHSVLRLYVREVRFLVNELYDRFQPFQPPPYNTWRLGTLPGESVFNHLKQAQQLLMADLGSVEALLSNAIRELPALTSIHTDILPTVETWVAALPDAWPTPASPKLAAHLLSTMPNQARSTNTQLAMLLAAAAESVGGRLQQVKATKLFAQFFSGHLNLLLDQAKGLRRADFDLNAMPMLVQSRRANQIHLGSLQRFFTAVPQLESMRIKFYLSRDDIPIIPLSAILGDTTFKNLSRLALCRLQVLEEPFLTLLMAAADTLRELHLKEMYLLQSRTGQWLGIFRCMAAKLRLERAVFEQRFYGELGERGEHPGYPGMDMGSSVMGSPLSVGALLGNILLARVAHRIGEELQSQVLEDLLEPRLRRPAGPREPPFAVRDLDLLGSFAEQPQA